MSTPTIEEALSNIAAYYVRIPRLRETLGDDAMSAARALEEIVNDLLPGTGKQRFMNPLCCHGYGSPHFWRPDFFMERLAVNSCADHPERRKSDDRRHSY